MIAAGILALGLAQSCANRPNQKDITQDTSLETKVSRNLIVSYDPAMGKKPLMEAVKQMGATLLYDYNNFNMIAIRIKDGVKSQVAKEYLQKVPGVTNVENDSVQRAQRR